MPEIVTCDEHSQVYDWWRARGARAISVAHVDFHCDLRGLVIDRRRQRARVIAPGGRMPPVDSGNFLAAAVMDGTVASITWVHDAHGGRRYDAGTVKYTTDLTAVRHAARAARSGAAWRPLAFRETLFDRWDGPALGDHLDIDWDGLASIEYAPEHRSRLAEQFLARDWQVVPEHTFVVYSPGYSDPDRALFDDFVRRLADLFEADVTSLPAPRLAAGLPKPPQQLGGAERLKHRLALGLHRLGIH
jgi:hypothetical protein